MRKILLILTMIILLSIAVIASAPAPSPKCYAEGVINSVEFKDAYNDPCVATNSCPSDGENIHPARYYLMVQLNLVKYVSGETKYRTCEEMLPLNTEQKIFLNKDEVKEGDTFKKGLEIKGQVSSFWGKSFDSYEVEPMPAGKCDITTDCKSNVYPKAIIILLVVLILLITTFIVLFLRKK
ncbi:hypothetical protein ACFLZX_02595 [Nanoarchaeota archaeon]